MPRPDAPSLVRLKNELDRLLAEVLDLEATPLQTGAWEPRIDVVESTGAITLVAEVPGLSAADLRVEVRGDLVIVSGEKTIAGPREDGVRFQRAERRHGRFSRQLKLYWPVDSHRGRAHLADGVLTVEFPKIDDQRRRVRCLPIEEVAPEAASDE